MSPGGGRLFVGHDLGTGGDKAVLVDASGAVLATAFEPYPLLHPQAGWAEQDPDDWWRAVSACTRRVMSTAGAAPRDVAAIGFAGQMLGLVPLGGDGRPTRPAVSWMDNRADVQARRITRRLGGERVLIAAVGAVPSGKDVVCKIAWIREHEPDVYARTAAFCDATGFLVARATGRIIADHTAAGGTGIASRRTRQWSRLLAFGTGTSLAKLPGIRPCTEVVGGLLPTPAADLGLAPDTPVVAGLADVPAAAVGSGALDPGDAHVYLGTSAWICLSAPKAKDVGRNGIVSVASPDPEAFLMIAESEAAGACAEWLRTTLDISDHAAFADLAANSAAGANGVLFAPWMYGERAPVTDTALRGGFVNLSLTSTSADLARAVYEGVAYNLRWICDAVADSGTPVGALRAIGGGARSELWLQTIADATGRDVQRVTHPQEAGAIGAALIAAVGVGALPDVRSIKAVRPVEATFTPSATTAGLHAARYKALRSLQPALSSLAAGSPRVL